MTAPQLTSLALNNIARRYPERAFAGFSRKSSTFLFYSMVHPLLTPDSVVLDIGAGRGAQGETPSRFMRDLITIKGKVARMVGADVDPVVLKNPLLDEAFIFTPGEPLPIPDGTFDVIVSDWTLEHVDDAAAFATEIERLLKPGGWFCARTPNKFGLISIAASLVPNRAHTSVLSVVQPERQDRDVFPTRYRLNTKSAIRHYFSAPRWEHHSFYLDTEVMYLTRFRLLFEIAERVAKIVPRFLLPVLMVFVRKSPNG